MTYRPPDTSEHLCKNFIERITVKLQAIQIENKETIIIGDINCDYTNTEGHQDIKTLFSINGFKQAIKKPTRVTERSSTIIDVILTNSPENIIHTDVVTTNLSDHELFMSKDPTYAWNTLKETVLKIASNHTLFTIKTIKGKPCPWLSESIKREMNFRDTINRRAQKNKTEENWNAYKR